MEDKCKECESWAHKMYWNHFKCMYFCQILEGHDFHSQLVSVIPFLCMHLPFYYSGYKLQFKLLVGRVFNWYLASNFNF